MATPLTEPVARGSGGHGFPWVMVFKLLLAIVAAWWISGIRIRVVPGIEGKVVLSDSGKPLTQAIVYSEVEWRYGFVALGLISAGVIVGGRADTGGSDQYECMTDLDGRFRQGPELKAYWRWGWYYDHGHQFRYLRHPLYAASRVTQQPVGSLSPWMIQVSVVAMRLSEYAKALLAGGQSLHVPFAASVYTQVGFLVGVEPYFWRSEGAHRVLRKDAFRDYPLIRAEWRQVSKILGSNPDIHLRQLESLQARTR